MAPKRGQTPKPLSIQLEYDSQELQQGESLQVKATIKNRTQRAFGMVMVDLPVPPGFRIGEQGLDGIRQNTEVGKVERTARQIIVYLRGITAGQSIEFSYQLRAQTPAEVTAPAAEVYEYYAPDQRDSTKTTRLKIKG